MRPEGRKCGPRKVHYRVEAPEQAEEVDVDHRKPFPHREAARAEPAFGLGIGLLSRLGASAARGVEGGGDEGHPGQGLRFGLGAESLAWVLVFAFAPISAVYYPVEAMPEWLQTVAWCTPSAYVFEGMRAILFDGQFRADLLAGAVLLNVLYLILGGLTFMLSFRLARRQGILHQLGE